MNNPISKSPVMLSNDLLNAIQSKMSCSKETLTDCIESLLLDAIYYTPNAETLEAIEEARNGKPMETLDLDHFQDFINSL